MLKKGEKDRKRERQTGGWMEAKLGGKEAQEGGGERGRKERMRT